MFRFLFALVLIATPFLEQAQKIEGLVKGKDTDLPHTLCYYFCD